MAKERCEPITSSTRTVEERSARKQTSRPTPPPARCVRVPAWQSAIWIISCRSAVGKRSAERNFRNLKLPKGISLHTLRHTHGSHLLAAGVPLTDVSKRLGHANPHVTATIYAHALPGCDDLAADAWEKFQKDAKPAKTRKARKSA
jgi:integrase